MSTLKNTTVAEKLAELHQLAAAQRSDNPNIYQLSPAERFMAVSPEQGQFLNFIAGLNKAKNIVEFGCSFGISGIYLAAAAKDNGGHVITTELEASKAETAQKNWQAAGVADYITVRTGDALQTLANLETVDFLFLDGAKELYLPIFELLYPKLTVNAIIIADNVDKVATHDLVDHLSSSSSFTTIHLFDGRMLAAYRQS